MNSPQTAFKDEKNGQPSIKAHEQLKNLGFFTTTPPQSDADKAALTEKGYRCYNLVHGELQPVADNGVWARPNVASALLVLWGLANHAVVNGKLEEYGEPFSTWRPQWTRQCITELKELIHSQSSNLAFVTIGPEYGRLMKQTDLNPDPAGDPEDPDVYLKVCLALAQQAAIRPHEIRSNWDELQYRRSYASMNVLQGVIVTRGIQGLGKQHNTAPLADPEKGIPNFNTNTVRSRCAPR